MPNPTLTPTLTALARELAERDLSRWPSCGCCRIFSPCTHCVAKQLLSALASPPVEAAQGEPLSVAERVPAEGVRVLAWLAQPGGTGAWHTMQWYGAANVVTHWMPLPPPPAAPEARR